MKKEELKTKVKEQVNLRHQELIELSLKIHANPELGLQERKAAAWLSDYIEKNGFRVERGITGLKTAFRGIYGSGKPLIALVAEYDALPELGHGCGHNIIASSAIGAGIASKVAIDQVGGSILILGTPGEELFGGKIIMVERGAFDKVDIAMMVHPGTRNMATTQTLACIPLCVEFIGKSAHAAAQPHKGINALEAMIMAFTAINSLRQQIREKARIHGIITDGGKAANVVPAHSAAKFLVRAEDSAYLEELKEKLLDCFIGASLATGAQLKYEWGDKTYAPMNNNPVLAQLFSHNLESLGRKIEPYETRFGFGSTDMGNVSQLVPSIHASVTIAPDEVSTHTPEFAKAAASEAGHAALVDAAKAMAMTAVDVLSEPETLTSIKEAFRQK